MDESSAADRMVDDRRFAVCCVAKWEVPARQQTHKRYGNARSFDVKSAPHAERYLPTKGKWVSAGSTIVDLHSPTDVVGCIQYPGGCYFPPGEVGPAVLRPDGTVFATGSYTNGGIGAGHTSVYHPGKSLSSKGTWVPGPDFPNEDNANDSWA